MARSPDRKRHALWRDRVRRQVTSGLTIAQFCDQESIARSKFYAWKRRFRLMPPGSALVITRPVDFSTCDGASSSAVPRNPCRSRPTFPMESAFVSRPRTPAWPAASSALSQEPRPTLEARDDQPPSCRPGVPPRSRH